MCSLGSSSSTLILRFLRSHYDLIYRLAQSSIFKNSYTQPNTTDSTSNEYLETDSFYLKKENDEYALATIQRSIKVNLLIIGVN